jgi:hypothetical protein
VLQLAESHQLGVALNRTGQIFSDMVDLSTLSGITIVPLAANSVQPPVYHCGVLQLRAIISEGATVFSLRIRMQEDCAYHGKFILEYYNLATLHANATVAGLELDHSTEHQAT